MFFSHAFSFPRALPHLHRERRVLKCCKLKKKKKDTLRVFLIRAEAAVPRGLPGGPLLNDFQLNFYRPKRLG